MKSPKIGFGVAEIEPHKTSILMWWELGTVAGQLEYERSEFKFPD